MRLLDVTVGLLGLFAVAGTATAQDVRVVDADTVVWFGTTYRLDGIDAPEREQTCLTSDGLPWRCGLAATAALNAFVNGKVFTCTDVGADKKYHRRLGQCVANGISIEHWLVHHGWAIEYKAHSDGRFAPGERDAERNRRGLWSGCFTNPRDFRYSNKSASVLMGVCPTSAEAVAKVKDELFWKGFAIKAKLFAVGRRLATGFAGIYHDEGCGSYGKMARQEGGQLLAFASADAAEASGFRKAKNCLIK